MKVYCEKPATTEPKVEIAQVVHFFPWPFKEGRLFFKAAAVGVLCNGNFDKKTYSENYISSDYPGWDCLVVGTDGHLYVAKSESREVKNFLEGRKS